jgi:hypothetical protein
LPYAASFVVGAIGIVVGHLARPPLRSARAVGGQSQIATAGLVLSYGGAILSIGLFLLITPVALSVSPSR